MPQLEFFLLWPVLMATLPWSINTTWACSQLVGGWVLPMWGKQFGQEPLVNANTAAVLELCLDSFFLVEPCHICRSIPQPQKVATSESFIDLRCCLHTSAVLEPSLTYIFCHEWSLSQGIPLPYPATGGYLATAVLLFGLFQSQSHQAPSN